MSQSLRVSLSTDAVIYLPFYLAYFGGDFKDTPYGSVDIQIVGLNDIRFKYYDEELEEESKELNPRLRGDAFMTLDVLFGIADIGVGDVGFVNILRGNTESDEKKRKEIFTTPDENGEDTLTRYLKYIDENTVGNNAIINLFSNPQNHIKALKSRIDETKLKIAGGLLRKPALKGIIKNKNYKEKPKNFLSFNKDNGFEAFTYPKHSTSYYFLKKQLESNKVNFKELNSAIDFGNEIEQAESNKVCFSCDFIALRMANKSTSGFFQDYHLIQDLTCGDERLLWSGFILNDNDFTLSKSVENKKKYRAFFYALDKNMQIISSYLNKNDSQGLHYYIKSKLTADKNKLGDVYKVLIANEQIKRKLFSTNLSEKLRPNSNWKSENTVPIEGLAEIVNKLIRQENKIDLDRIIRFYIKDLYYVENEDSSLYYQSLNIINKNSTTDAGSKDEVYNNDILKTIQLRQSELTDFPRENENSIVIYDVMEDWRKIEIEYHRNNNKFLYRNFKSKKYLKSLTIIISLVGVVSFLEPFFTPFFNPSLPSIPFKHITLMPTLFLIGVLFFIGIKYLNKRLDTIDKEPYMYMDKELLKKRR